MTYIINHNTIVSIIVVLSAPDSFKFLKIKIPIHYIMFID